MSRSSFLKRLIVYNPESHTSLSHFNTCNHLTHLTFSLTNRRIPSRSGNYTHTWSCFVQEISTIIQYNDTLRYFSLKGFWLPVDLNSLRLLVNVLADITTLQSIELNIECDSDSQDDKTAEALDCYVQLKVTADSRIQFKEGSSLVDALSSRTVRTS